MKREKTVNKDNPEGSCHSGAKRITEKDTWRSYQNKKIVPRVSPE